jgi:hypothetical protein
VIFDNRTLNALTELPTRRSFYRQALLIGLGIFAVLAVFQPFGTYVFEHKLKYWFLAGYGLLVPLTAFVLRESIALFWHRFFDREYWTFRRELWLSGLFLLLSVVMSYFYHHLMIGSRLSFTGFLFFLSIALTTAVLPLSLFFLWRFYEVKNHLTTQALSEKLAYAARATPGTDAEYVVLQGENKNEKLTLLRSEIHYLRAADNYVEIFLQKNGQTQRLMLRGALSHIAQQLEKVGTFRQVHRSFVVNFEHPIRLEGKSPTYFLVFENATDMEEIPVSRSQASDIRAILAEKPR